MNSKTELILYCLIKSKEYFDEIDDFENVSSIIFQYVKVDMRYVHQPHVEKIKINQERQLVNVQYKTDIILQQNHVIN